MGLFWDRYYYLFDFFEKYCHYNLEIRKENRLSSDSEEQEGTTKAILTEFDTELQVK